MAEACMGAEPERTSMVPLCQQSMTQEDEDRLKTQPMSDEQPNQNYYGLGTFERLFASNHAHIPRFTSAVIDVSVLFRLFVLTLAITHQIVGL